MNYANALLSLVLLNIVLTSATVVLHEAGHFAFGTAIGCSGMKIILLDSSFDTYTEMQCPPMNNFTSAALALSGFLLVIPFSALLFLSKGYEKYYSFIIIGFDIAISSSDLAFMAEWVFYVFSAIGLVSIAYGEIFLANQYILPNKKLY